MSPRLGDFHGQVATPSIDLWPHRLFWLGDPRACTTFGVKVPKGELGPWRGKDPNWRERSCRTTDLEQWLANNEPNLRVDAYASINRFYRLGRKQEYVVRLGATFLDIDCGRRDGDWSTDNTVEAIRELVVLGRLLSPSLLQFSGRGLWAFWLLRDEQHFDSAAYARPFANRQLWMALQRHQADVILDAFPGLKVDRNALDLGRVTRLHGSINSSSGRSVRYELLPGADGEPIRYTLTELTGFYGLDLPEAVSSVTATEHRDTALEAHRRRQDEAEVERIRRKEARTGVNSNLSVWGRLGHNALWQGRLRFLERVRIEVHGGVIPHGLRFKMLSAYAYCFAKLSKDQAALEAKIFTIHRAYCEKPPNDRFQDAEIQGIARHGRKWSEDGYTITNRRFAESAGLDPFVHHELIERLGLNLSTGPKGRKERTQARQEAARKILKTALARGAWPLSAGQLATTLTEAGYDTCRSTAHTLLRKLTGELRPSEVHARARPVSRWARAGRFSKEAPKGGGDREASSSPLTSLMLDTSPHKHRPTSLRSFQEAIEQGFDAGIPAPDPGSG